MKRITIISTLVLGLFLMAFLVVRAETRSGHRWCNHHRHAFGPANYLAHKLKLSEDQKAQSQALWQAEQRVLSAHIHELLADNKAMDAIAAQSNPDPAAMQTIADREAHTIAAMLVEKARLQSKIYSTVLHPDQRAKADAIQQAWESRLDRFADGFAAQSEKK